MKGNNTLILNEATLREALTEYFERRFAKMNFHVDKAARIARRKNRHA